MTFIPRTHNANGKEMTPKAQRITAARESKVVRQAEDKVNYSRPLEVESDWTLGAVLEMATEYAAFWGAEAVEKGLKYDGGYPSVLEVAQKSLKACIWISGDTYPSRGQLRAWGFVWSKNKSAWYCGEGELERAKGKALVQVAGMAA